MVCFSACPSPREPEAPVGPHEISRNGVTVRLIDPGSPAWGTGASNGDALMQSQSLRAVIASAASPRPGALVDLAHGGWETDALKQLSVVVSVAGKPVALKVDAVELDSQGSTPGVRVRHSSKHPALSVVTRFGLSRDSARVDIESRLTAGQALSGVRLGDQLQWFGAPLFIPGAGFLETPKQVTSRWAALVGEQASYSLLSRDPLHWDAGSARGERLQTAWTKAAALARGGELDLSPQTADGTGGTGRGECTRLG